MKRSQNTRRRERATRVYRWLLRLYPGLHRRTFGEQMLQTFQDHYRDAVETDGIGPARFWLGVFGDASRSLAREHIAAIREGVETMKRALGPILAAGVLVIGILLALSPGRAAGQAVGPIVGDGALRFFLWMALLGLTLAIYAALVAAIVAFVRRSSWPANRVGWLRLGLALGGVFSLFMIISNVAEVLLPAPQDGGPGGGFLVLTLPLLLTGVVGVIGGYSAGSTRAGIGAGLLTGFLGLVVGQLSWVLVVALVWPAIQHGLLLSGVQSDFQRYTQALGHAPDLVAFLNLELFEDGVAFPIIVSLITLTLEGICAALGGFIGASLQRADEYAPQTTRPTSTSATPLPSC